VTLLAAVTLLLVASPATALDVHTSDARELPGGVVSGRLEVRLPGGQVARGDITRFSEDEPTLSLQPRLARDQVAGLEGVCPLTGRPTAGGAVAGVNGGCFFWNDAQMAGPIGTPNGLFFEGGGIE